MDRDWEAAGVLGYKIPQGAAPRTARGIVYISRRYIKAYWASRMPAGGLFDIINGNTLRNCYHCEFMSLSMASKTATPLLPSPVAKPTTAAPALFILR